MCIILKGFECVLTSFEGMEILLGMSVILNSLTSPLFQTSPKIWIWEGEMDYNYNRCYLSCLV